MELMIPLKGQGEQPLYEQIYEYMKEEIRKKSLPSRAKLPSTRALANHLKVSRSTTQMAYDQLVSEGYIEAEPCRGYFVAEIEELLGLKREDGSHSLLEEEPQKEKYQVDFSPRGIDLGSFPFSVWRKLSRNTLVDDNREMFSSGDPQGEAALRETIKNYLHTARGVKCHAGQIVVGAGNEYLLMLLSQIIGRNHLIAMENPTYKQAYRVLKSLGYQVEPVEMDRNGIHMGLLEKSGANTVYVMPSHQYPTGIVMPVKRRMELLSWAAEKEERYIIEDDYDSEFRYKGKPIPALQGMDKSGQVIYIGTFSRSIAPAIRIGYMVLPEKLLAVYRERVSFYASTVSRIDQNILFQFISGGYYERHLNRMRAVYKGKHDALLTELRALEDRFDIKGENAGIHVLLTSRENISERNLMEKAAERGVRVYGFSGYFIRQPKKVEQGTVVLGYANLSEDEIRAGIALLSEAWKKGVDAIHEDVEQKGESSPGGGLCGSGGDSHNQNN